MSELKDALWPRIAGKSTSQLQELFGKMDMDNNGFISFNEFVVAAADKQKLLSERNLEMAFSRID